MAINAALLLALGLSSAQDTRMNMQFAAPQPDNGPAVSTNFIQTLNLNQNANLVLTATQAQGGKITKSFHSAPAQEVLKWLEGNGVNFVVADRDVANREVTLSVLDEPIDNVIQAIGEALDGKFEKKGNLYVFHRTRRVGLGDKWNTDNVFKFSQSWGKDPVFLKGDVFNNFQFKPGQGMTEKDMQELHKALGNLKRMQGMNGKDMAELKKALSGMKGQVYSMDPKEMAELHKRWESAHQRA